MATAYVIWRQVRLTLAVHYVLPDEEALEILKILLERLQKLGFSAKVLYMDKGFAATPIIEYLTKDAKQPAIIANPGQNRRHEGFVPRAFQLHHDLHLHQRNDLNFGHESFSGS